MLIKETLSKGELVPPDFDLWTPNPNSPNIAEIFVNMDPRGFIPTGRSEDCIELGYVTPVDHQSTFNLKFTDNGSEVSVLLSLDFDDDKSTLMESQLSKDKLHTKSQLIRYVGLLRGSIEDFLHINIDSNFIPTIMLSRYSCEDWMDELQKELISVIDSEVNQNFR